MTTSHRLTCTWTAPDEHTCQVVVEGELTYDSADELLRSSVRHIQDRPALRELRVDCAGLGVCDSWGLAVLLQIRRHLLAANAGLSLDNRSRAFERLLDITGTLGFLTGTPPLTRGQSQDS
ncbi:STAS domain-containing protein [Kutzneria viridogrisea]|uniref:STAS domain-containing protein n=2 Tax=Kutzneria TaxID=43356 RepID=W5WBB1_9PSEU|nr:STAS domain-containing protein [Kutzneria albida]AHH98132.1 hypothetical protein KALB_4770 [Kutzneria albida DSM 43870]MBA8924185.1 anti-anti-sigma factor [Kutzneria viridogrisea]